MGWGFDRKRGGGAEQTWTRPVPGWKQEVDDGEEKAAILQHFNPQTETLQCGGSSRPNTRSLTWPVSQHSECG